MISNIIGVLGFILALYTFIITRIERRKSLSIDIYVDEREEWSEELLNGEHSFVIAKIVNDGERRIHLDINTVRFYANKKPYQKYELDLLFGEREVPYPINPGQSFELGVLEGHLTSCAGYDSIGKYKVDIGFSISDQNGKKFKNKSKYTYIGEVGVIEKNS